MKELNSPIADGQELYNLAKILYPINRSLTGKGVEESLAVLKHVCPNLVIHKIPTGTKVQDWIIPDEWNIRDAWVKNSLGTKVIDFKNNNLHVVGYSLPVHKYMKLDELQNILYSIPEQPDAIPYITSYYTKRFGFCISQAQRDKLKDDTYEIYIDSTLEPGNLTYGDIVIPGKTKKEILFTTYICHPSMANNELSGPVIAIYLAKMLSSQCLYYTYRFVFVPETIGSIMYITKNFDILKKNLLAGYILTCCGDNGDFSYLPTKYGDTLADKIALNILSSNLKTFKKYSWLDRGSDERQYNSPGVDLPVCSVMRSKYGSYKEYHTSKDDLNYITPDALFETFLIYKKIIEAFEHNKKYKVMCLCEPQLGKRGLYPTLSTKATKDVVQDMMNLISYCDGKNDLCDISNKINVNIMKLVPIVEKLVVAGVLECIK